MSDFQYMVECTTRDLVVLLMEYRNLSIGKALDMLYNSQTYEKLLNKKTGLYFQSPYYIYELLINEIEKCKEVCL